jgi:spore coat protein H
MAPGDLSRLDISPGSNETYPATFLADGEVFPGARVRYRGDWARTWPKRPFKVFLDKDRPFAGHDCLNLNSCWRDPAFVRELLAYHTYAACGVPAPRAHMVRLDVNGRFHGLYVEVEQPEKAFLKRVNLKGAVLFKADSSSKQSDERDLGDAEAYRRHYEQETRKSQDCTELQLFCHELATTSNVLDFFTRHVDLDRYVNYLAATVLVQNWDCYNKNHFLAYDERGSRKWVVIPWDLDRTFGDHWHEYFGEARLPVLHGTRQIPGPTGWNRLADRFFSEPRLRTRFMERLEELLDTEFTPAKLFPLLDRLEEQIGPDVTQDRRQWPGVSGGLHRGIAEVKSYIEQRRAFLRAEVDRMGRSSTIRRFPGASSGVEAQ